MFYFDIKQETYLTLTIIYLRSILMFLPFPIQSTLALLTPWYNEHPDNTILGDPGAVSRVDAMFVAILQ